MSPQSLQPSLSLFGLTVREQLSIQDFKDGNHGGHLGYWNRPNFAILNLHVTLISPTKFGHNSTYHSGANVVFQDGHSEQHDFCNSVCLYIARMHPIIFPLNPTRFGRGCRLKIFKMADMAAILDIETE